MLSSGVLLEEACRLECTQSQVLRGAMEIGLLSQNTEHDFLELLRESKRFHQRNEQDKTHFEERHLENTRILMLRGKSSREHQTYQGCTSRVTI